MPLILQRDLVIFDIESTGTNVREDRIIELGIIKLSPGGGKKEWSKRFNPGIPIPKEASDVHGITDEMVQDCPPFSDHAALILRGLENCDVAGFNIKAYDLPLLAAECERAGLVLDWKSMRTIDAAVLFKKFEERTLSAAVKFYLNQEHTDAHGALADCIATANVLSAQIDKYGLSHQVHDLDELSKYDGEEERADITGSLIYVNGILTYSFGKNKGKSVISCPDYGRWVLKSDFSMEIKNLIKKELN